MWFPPLVSTKDEVVTVMLGYYAAIKGRKRTEPQLKERNSVEVQPGQPDTKRRKECLRPDLGACGRVEGTDVSEFQGCRAPRICKRAAPTLVCAVNVDRDLRKAVGSWWSDTPR